MIAMTDFLLRLIAFAALVLFLGVLVWKVPRVDLGLVVAISLALAAWDFFGPKRRA